MNIKKNVIEVIKKPDYPSGYNEIYYFTGISLDNNGHISVNTTPNIWDALRFMCNPNFDSENKKLMALVDFIQFFYGRKYEVNVISINLEY